MHDFLLEYYRIISSISGLLSAPIRNVADSVNLPVISVLLFGVLGATAPCQLSTSVAAFAYFSRQAQNSRHLGMQMLAFLGGRLTVYVVVGTIVVLLGLQMQQITESAIPIVVFARRAMGPLLIIVGVFMLGVLSFRFSIGDKVSTWLYNKIGERKGFIPSYILGIAFSFTFCPTLFWLFFGLTIPLAIASPGGIIFPAIFATGTLLPLFTLALLTFYALPVRQMICRVKGTTIWLQRIAGLVFILVGINEIVLYWLL